MRKTNICQCQHNRILLAEQMGDATDFLGRSGAGLEREGHTYCPLFAALVKKANGNYVGAGKLSALICKRCGHTELFVADPSSIPIDGVDVRELVGPEPTSSYR